MRSSSALLRSSLLVFSTVAGGTTSDALAAPPTGASWGLAFADEFNGTTLDSMKWVNGYPWDLTTRGARPENVTVGNGVLNLIQSRGPDGTFTGCAVATRIKDTAPYDDKFAFTYGYAEASMRMPSKAGSWPAFWMLQGGWPPEIDIMEYPIFTDSSSTPNTRGYNTAYHYTNASGNHASAGGYRNTNTDFSAALHTWGLRWTATSMSFYLDGQLTNSVANLTAAQIQQAKNMYILLTNGNGEWAGTPSQAEWANGTSDRAQVDWVRVWKDVSGGPSTSTWQKAGDGSWDEAAAWSAGAAPALHTQRATFGQVNAANVAVTWRYSRTVGSVRFAGTTNYTLGSVGGVANGLMLASANGPALIDSTAASGAGSNAMNSRLELYDDTTIRAGTKPLAINGSIVGSGGLRIESGYVTLGGASTYAGATTVAGGVLRLASTGSIASSLFDIAGGTFDVSAHPAFSLPQSAVLRGGGRIAGTVDVAGTVEPGGGVGTLKADAMTFASGSKLILQLGGIAAGTTHDRLESSGVVTLQSGSSLTLLLVNGFAPADGDAFQVLVASRISGAFTSVELPKLSEGLSWDLSAVYANGRIAVVPEAGTSCLIAGTLAALRHRRRYQGCRGEARGSTPLEEREQDEKRD